jgi:hypothetical protein
MTGVTQLKKKKNTLELSDLSDTNQELVKKLGVKLRSLQVEPLESNVNLNAEVSGIGLLKFATIRFPRRRQVEVVLKRFRAESSSLPPHVILKKLTKYRQGITLKTTNMEEAVTCLLSHKQDLEKREKFASRLKAAGVA